MKKNLYLLTSVTKSKTKIKKPNNSLTYRKPKKNIRSETLQDMQKDLILNLSKSPDVILKSHKFKNTKDFPAYIRQLDNLTKQYLIKVLLQ